MTTQPSAISASKWTNPSPKWITSTQKQANCWLIFRPWSDFLLDSTTGKEIRDGNLVVNLAGAKTYQRRLKTSASTEILINTIKTVEDLRNSQAFVDSKAYYLPGIDANTVEINVSGVPEVLDADYVPHHPKAVTGAVDITSRQIPGCFLYRSWRGAIPPKKPQ